MIIHRATILALVVGLSACTTAPPPAPVLSYAAVGCSAAPDLSRAIDLLPGKRTGETVRTVVDGTTPCVEVDGFKTPYLLYRMPIGPGRMIDVGGAVEQVRVLPALVTILGENGERMRTFPAHQYLNRGDRYSVQLVPQNGERFILVTVDPALVGSNYDGVQTGVATSFVGTGTWTSGVDRTSTWGRSYHGAVVATVFDTTPGAR